MISLTINGIDTDVEPGTTLLEAAQGLGFPIPTLCHMEGLTPYGACRLCLVEVGQEPRSRLVTACTYPAEQGLQVRTNTRRVTRARRMIIELLLASSPHSKIIQDLASQYEVHQQRFRQEHEDCILCGRCVRVCEEQMMAKAIGFRGRGERRTIGTPFDVRSEKCRLCGACMYVCPVCQERCTMDGDHAICGACVNLAAPCLEIYPDAKCYLDPCAACEIERAAQISTGATTPQGRKER